MAQRNSSIINAIISLVQKTLDKKSQYRLNGTIIKEDIEAPCSCIRISESEIRFIGSSDSKNHIVIYLNDIIMASVEEYCKKNTTNFRFDLKNGEQVTIILSKDNNQ